ncbi:MAG: ester cyclase [Myxococcota bacterium]
MTNTELVRFLYQDVVNARRFERLTEVLSPALAPEFEAAVRVLLTGFPDVRFHLVELLAEGARVVVRWQWSGTHTGPFRGIAPTGKFVLNDGVVFFSFEAGRATSAWTLNDRLGVLQALGVVEAGLAQVKPVKP